LNIIKIDKDRVFIDNNPELDSIPSKIYDRNNKLIGQYSTTKRTRVKLNDLPMLLKRSIILMEDRKFYTHKGIDYTGIARAILINLKELIKHPFSFRIRAGGSTLTQQLCKVLFTRHEKTLGRKIYELFIAREIERIYSKDDIFLMYINHIYLGHGCYGAEAASRMYFNKSVRELNVYEISIIAGIISSPNYYSPIKSPARAKRKSNIVLKLLAREKYISQSTIKRAETYFWPSYTKSLKSPNIAFWKMDINEAPYFNEFVRQTLIKYFSVDELLKNGYKIYTTLDIEYNKTARNALKSGLRIQDIYYRKKMIEKAEKNKEKLKINDTGILIDHSNIPECEGALIALKNSTGEILTMIGGRNYSFQNQLNRTYQIRRQVGSTLKPFIYLEGFENTLFNQYTVFNDIPKKYKIYGNKYYSPANYSGKFYGRITAQDALVRSVNTVAVQALDLIDPETFVKHISRIFPDKKIEANLSIALGTLELSPMELAIMYAVLGNGGKNIEPYGIKKITDIYDNVIFDFETDIFADYEHSEKNDTRRIFSEAGCYILTGILKKVFSDSGTAGWAASRKNFNINAAGKTGTTDNYSDAWMAGYTPEMSTVVWLGYDKQKN
ncbi:MAG: transglycosylase domain-containing protein, partial [Actinomycetia bacterium]|nr:transglycosylase domain-containing protein [Actinomycetes bacterium]